MNNNWKVFATEFLSARSVNKSLLQSIYKKITGKNCSSDLLKSNIIEEILAKSSTPHDILSKQEITAALLRSYLDIDPKDTVYSVQELHDMITEKWTASSAASAPSTSSIPLSQETNASTTSVGGSTSTSTSTKRKRDDSIQQDVRKQRVELNNWWKVTNCVTEKASCSGTTETGFVVTPSFPNCDIRTGSEINGEGNIIYILGNHSPDGDQIEDNFGPWPKKMSSLNAVHLQFRSLQSESITEFSNRLGMSVGGTRLDHLSSSMLLFNTLKLINAIEVKKTLRKAVEGLPGHDASSFPENLITLLETEHNVPPELIVAADRVDQLKTQLNEECLKVHTILYSKDKKQVLQSAIQRANSASAAGAPIVKDLSQTIYKNRLRSLDACEKRAERCREEAEIEKKAMEAAAKAGKEAEKRQQLEQIRAQVDALEVKISSRNKTLDRLRGNANSIDRNIIESTLQLREVRNRMAQSILTCGQYDHHQKTENDAISCSLIGLQETYQCIMDHIGVEEESLRKEVKQLSTLQAKLE